MLTLAEPSDIQVVCGDWDIGSQPDVYSKEKEVVLPVTKITTHPSYSRYGPGDGYDIAVLHVDDTKLKVEGVVREGYIYPACLPSEEELVIGKKGIFAAWKDPFPVYVYYNLDILGISESRWTGAGKLTSRGHLILHSGHENQHYGGVAVILNKRIKMH